MSRSILQVVIKRHFAYTQSLVCVEEECQGWFRWNTWAALSMTRCRCEMDWVQVVCKPTDLVYCTLLLSHKSYSVDLCPKLHGCLNISFMFPFKNFSVRMHTHTHTHTHTHSHTLIYVDSVLYAVDTVILCDAHTCKLTHLLGKYPHITFEPTLVYKFWNTRHCRCNSGSTYFKYFRLKLPLCIT